MPRPDPTQSDPLQSDSLQSGLSAAWLSVPQDRAVYTDLSTDHYPWPEVYADLEARLQPGGAAPLTGVLDARQGEWRGRCLWVGGALQGGYLQGPGQGGLPVQHRISGPDTLGRALPGGAVSLTLLDPRVAHLVWACHQSAGEPLGRRWPEVRADVAARALSGALLSERGACSYWQAGQLLGGRLPERGEAVRARVLETRVEPGELLGFWSALLPVLGEALPGGLEPHWRAATSLLAEQHPCLDPFAREVWWTPEGGVQAHPDVTADELRPALLDVYSALLRRGALNPRALPLGELRQRRLWLLAGLQGEAPAQPEGAAARDRTV